MTLALHGKSRRRVQGLIFAAFMAVIAAAILGVSVISVAFAHHNVYTPDRECDESWSATATYVGGDSERLIVLTDVVINNAAFDASWESGLSGSFATAGFPASSAFAAGQEPSGTVRWWWSGVDGGGTIFNRSGGAGTFNSSWGGKIILFAKDGDGKWTTVGASGGGFPATYNITAPAAPSGCTATIIVKKTVVGTAPPPTNFVVNIDDLGNGAGSDYNDTVAVGDDYTQVVTGIMTGDGNGSGDLDDFTVTETNGGPGWTIVGWAYLASSTATCQNDVNGILPGDGFTAGGIASGSHLFFPDLVNVDQNETITICFKNQYTPPGDVTFSKTLTGQNPASTTNPSQVTWTITVSNPANGVNPKSAQVRDTNVAIVSGPTYSGGNNFCDLGGTSLTGANGSSCQIPAGGSVSWVVRPVPTPTRTCDPQNFNNTAQINVSDLAVVWQDFNGPQITLQGNPELCGSITWDKKAGEMHGSHIDWDIVITNTFASAQSVTIWDPGVSFEDTTQCVTFSQNGDNFTCQVAANSVATVTVTTPLPQGFNPVCDNFEDSNTAATAQNFQSSDTEEFTHTAEPDASCITIDKETSDTTQPPTFTIRIQNSSDVDVAIWVRDQSAVSHTVVSGGICGGGSIATGIPCSVYDNDTLVISVTTTTPVATCEGTDVPNTVEVWIGKFEAQPTSLPDKTDTDTHQNVNADPDLCDQTIKLCKVWRPNAIINPDTNFQFQASDSSEEDPAVQVVTIFNVTEGGGPECILLQVSPGQVNFNELVPPGFILEGYSVLPGDNPDADNTPNFILANNPEPWDLDIFVPGECGGIATTLVDQVLGLVRSIAAMVVEVQTGTPVCTITFFNRDDGITLNSGDLRIEKYRDVNGDGDANDVALGEGPIGGWDMTTVGGPINETVPTEANQGDPNFGSITYPGQISGTLFMVTEEMPAGWHVTNTTVDGITIGASTVAGTTIPNGGTTIIRFYNQQLGSINIHKQAVTSHNSGPDVAAPNDDDGWTFTLVSAGCGINFVGQTDANGNLSFTGLPLCTDYVVTEVQPNAASPGFVLVSPAGGSFTNQTPNGQTLTFLNRRTTSDPPCQDCRQQTPTTTPTTPTATPTTPTATPTTPTASPTTPTSGSSPTVTAIAGEKTPGATPIAPSAGNGLLGGASGGLNVLLMLAGLAALSAGLATLALGRKRR